MRIDARNVDSRMVRYLDQRSQEHWLQDWIGADKYKTRSASADQYLREQAFWARHGKNAKAKNFWTTSPRLQTDRPTLTLH